MVEGRKANTVSSVSEGFKIGRHVHLNHVTHSGFSEMCLLWRWTGDDYALVYDRDFQESLF